MGFSSASDTDRADGGRRFADQYVDGAISNTEQIGSIPHRSRCGDGRDWLVASDGEIFSFGEAPFLGSVGGTPSTKPVVGLAA